MHTHAYTCTHMQKFFFTRLSNHVALLSSIRPALSSTFQLRLPSLLPFLPPPLLLRLVVMRRHRPKCWWHCASRIRVRGHNKFSSGRSDEFLQGLHFLLFCCLFWVFSEPLTRWRRRCCSSSSHAAWAYLFCPLGSLVGCAALFAVAAARLKCARQRNYLMHVSPFCQDFYLHCVTCVRPPFPPSLTQTLPVSGSCV